MRRMAGIVLFLAVWAGGADMATEFFDKANRLYEKGSYDSALIYYEKVLSMGLYDARVYYNMGNAYFRKNALGRAILHYELALRLSPLDKDIRDNLKFARAATIDKIPPRNAGILERAVLSLHNLFSLTLQSWLFLVFLYVLSGLVIFYLAAHARFHLPARNATIVFSAFLLLFSASFFIKVFQEKSRKEAVVISEKVSARNEPDGGQVLFSVHEGAKFILTRKVGEWYFASLENGVSGWVHEADLGLIELP